MGGHYLGDAQHPDIGAGGGGAISRAQQPSNDAAHPLYEDAPAGTAQSGQHSQCPTPRHAQILDTTLQAQLTILLEKL